MGTSSSEPVFSLWVMVWVAQTNRQNCLTVATFIWDSDDVIWVFHLLCAAISLWRNEVLLLTLCKVLWGLQLGGSP